VTAIVLVCAACNRRADPPGAPASGAAAPAAAAAPATLPAFDALSKARPALVLRSTSVLVVARDGVAVTVTDERRFTRNAAGDFDFQVRRVHAGSEAGDTEENFRAIRVGRDFYTRGSGGPSVRWDDSRDEPEKVAASAWEAGDLLSLAATCADSRRDGARTVLAGRPGECRLPWARTDPPATLRVTAVDAEVRWEGELPASVTVSLGFQVEAGGRTSDVTLKHRTDVQDLPAAARIEAPADAVASRRERPVRMIQQVLSGLSGLGGSWGPGAPPAEARPGARTSENANGGQP
jgi:hypothetical protein